jgi:LEA14-like dessication related protein
MMRAILLLSLGGCATLGSVIESAEKPTAELVDAHLQAIGLDRSTVAFDVKIHNPYSVDLPLVNARYGLASEGQNFLSGEANLAGVIPAGGEKTFTVPATVFYEELLGVLEHFRPGQVVPYQAQVSLFVNAPGGTRIELPLNRTGELPIPAVPLLQVVRVDWDQVGLGGASGVVRLAIENTNQFPLEIDGLDYSLSLGGNTIASTKLDQDLALARGERREVGLAIELPTTAAVSTIVNLLRDRDVDYGIEGALSVSTPFGDMQMPFDRKGKTEIARK